MSTLPIAANLPSAMYTPLVLLIVAYGALVIMAARARASEDRAKADQYANLGFVLVLVSAAYVIVLLIASAFSYPSRFTDMVTILVVITVFFGLLLFLFFVLAEVVPRAFRRGGER